MKKLIFRLLVFSAMTAGLCISVTFLQLSDGYIIYKTYNTDFHKIAYNINLINNQPERVTNALIFLGPSTVNLGICDSTLISNGIKAVNLGINNPGQEIELYFLKRILKYQPKKYSFLLIGSIFMDYIL